jgi:hypothetical protein
MSKKQGLALKIAELNISRNENEKEGKEINSRCTDGLKNYQKLREIFPWLAEENESYL